MADGERQRSSSSSQPINPVPLSLPSILVNARPRTAPLTRSKRPPVASSSTTGVGASGARRVGKRKLLRLENARFSTAINPHVVRPLPSDFSPCYEPNRYEGSFKHPVPVLFNELGKADRTPRNGREVKVWRTEMEQLRQATKRSTVTQSRRGETATATASSFSPTSSPIPSGLFNMSLPEARFFLKRKAVVESRMDHPVSASVPSSSPSSISSSPSMQSLVDLVEDDFSSWQDQVVYLFDEEINPPRADTTRLNPRPRLVVPAFSPLDQARVEKHHHLPHSLSYLIPDSFDRLTIHCLARMWGMKSLSKAIEHNGEALKLTWILKPPPLTRRCPASHLTSGSENGSSGHVNPLIKHLARSFSTGHSAGAHRSSVASPRPNGLDTPPPTDVSSESEQEEGWSADQGTIESSSVASLPSSDGESGRELGGLSDVGEQEDEVEEETPRPPLEGSPGPLIDPVSCRLEGVAIVNDYEVGFVDDTTSLLSCRDEREYEAEGEGEGEEEEEEQWQ